MAELRRSAIDKLPLEERRRLVEDGWESIRSNPDSLPVTTGQRAELDLRLAAHENHPDAAEDLDPVVSRLRRRGR